MSWQPRASHAAGTVSHTSAESVRRFCVSYGRKMLGEPSCENYYAPKSATAPMSLVICSLAYAQRHERKSTMRSRASLPGYIHNTEPVSDLDRRSQHTIRLNVKGGRGRTGNAGSRGSAVPCSRKACGSRKSLNLSRAYERKLHIFRVGLGTRVIGSTQVGLHYQLSQVETINNHSIRPSP